MNTKKNSLTGCLLVLILLFHSCNDSSNEQSGDQTSYGSTLTAEMGSDLAQQVYVDLSAETLTSVAVNTWELAFENTESGIRTNTAKKVAIAIPDLTFDEITSDEDLTYYFDSEDRNLETTALAEWSTNKSYIIDLGIDENGNALGLKKFEITAYDDSSITINYADLDGSNFISTNLSKNTDRDFTFFSLIDNQTVSVEPKNWDFVLTGVSVRTGAPCFSMGNAASPGVNCDIYRLAASALINRYNSVSVAVDNPFSDLEQDDDPDSEKNIQSIESSNYHELTIEDFTSLGSSSDADTIGRSWKQILSPHSDAVYKVYDFITYLLKDAEGNYYKLRFLAYKGGDNAENGNPTFEYALITE